MRRRPTLSPAERRIVTSAYTNMTITLIGRYRCVDTVLKNQFNLAYPQAHSVIERVTQTDHFRMIGDESGTLRAAPVTEQTVGRTMQLSAQRS
jgi:hypothetical protein